MRRHRHADNIDSVVYCFNLYEKKMYHIAYAILQDAFMAEDAVMDAFEKLLSVGRVIDEPESDRTKRFMIKVIQSAAIDIYRKNRRRNDREVLMQRTETEFRHMPESDTEKIERKEADNEILSLLAGFPEKYRSVLQERFFKEKSVKETAKELGISESAVRKRQERGLAMLRDRRENTYGH